MTLPRLLVLTDRRQLPNGRRLVETIAECADAGLTHVVLRELDLAEETRAGLAAHLADTGVQVISAHTQLPGCIGVHLPAAGGTITGIWGRSCHSPGEVAAAAEDGADYATLSPFAATVSKPDYGPPLPSGAFAHHPIPVFALGGIGADNAAEAIAAGAYGIAVMGQVMRAADPALVVEQLVEATSSGAGSPGAGS